MKALKRHQCLSYIDQLRNFINLTNPISEETWNHLCEIMNFHQVEKNTRILDYMEKEMSIRFLGKGIVKCEDHYNGQSFVYDFRVAPIILCETVSLLNETPSRITIETITECEFIEFPRDDYKAIMKKDIDLAIFSSIGIANYLGMTHYKQALLRTLSAGERYKHFLKEFPTVALEAKLSDIASYIDIKQQSLSRLRKEICWKEDENNLQVLSNELEVVHRS